MFNLLSTTTEGDLPLMWTLRSSVAAPSSERSVEFTDDDYRAWNKAWQDFYAGKGPKPSMPLAPGTNSPEPDDSITVIVNPPQVAITVPPATPAAAPQVIQVPAPAAAAPRPAAPAQADSPSTCESNRQIKFTWSSSAKSGRLVYRGRSVAAKRSGGKLAGHCRSPWHDRSPRLVHEDHPEDHEQEWQEVEHQSLVQGLLAPRGGVRRPPS